MALPNPFHEDQAVRRNFEDLDTRVNERVRKDRVSLTGARNDPEAALANLITLLATAGVLIDNTTAS